MKSNKSWNIELNDRSNKWIFLNEERNSSPMHVIWQKIQRNAIIQMTKPFERPDVFNKRVTKSFERFNVSIEGVTKLFERIDVSN